MKNSSPNRALLIAAGATLGALVIVAGILFANPSLLPGGKALDQARSEAVLAEAELMKIRAGYINRLDLIQEMIKLKAFDSESSAEIERLSRVLREAELKTQIDFDQYDQHQNKLSNKVAEYFAFAQKDSELSNSDGYRSLFRKFETLEREIERSRVAYTRLALNVNQKVKEHSRVAKAHSELPLFRATAQAVEMEQSASKQ